jgi:hypothetical protein
MPVLRCRLLCGRYFAANAIRARSVPIESGPKLWISVLTRFLHANPYPLRLKTLWPSDVDALLPFLTDVAAILSEHG